MPTGESMKYAVCCRREKESDRLWHFFRGRTDRRRILCEELADDGPTRGFLIGESTGRNDRRCRSRGPVRHFQLAASRYLRLTGIQERAMNVSRVPGDHVRGQMGA